MVLFCTLFMFHRDSHPDVTAHRVGHTVRKWRVLQPTGCHYVGGAHLFRMSLYLVHILLLHKEKKSLTSSFFLPCKE